MNVLETKRLVLRRLTVEDAPLILKLVNEPAWLRYIGDNGIRTLEEAGKYIERGPIAMYARMGFGLYLVELKETGQPIGICGLIKRESLEDVDIGFAFLEEFWARGYGFESASAVLSHGRRDFGLARIVAISSQGNQASVRLLKKLGFQFERLTRLKPGAEEVELYAIGTGDSAEGGLGN